MVDNYEKFCQKTYNSINMYNHEPVVDQCDELNPF